MVDISECRFGDVVVTASGMKGRFVGGSKRNKHYYKVWIDDCDGEGEESGGDIFHFTKDGRNLEGGIGDIEKVEGGEGGNAEEYEWRLNELSTENIVMGKMMDDFMEVVGRRSQGIPFFRICRGLGCEVAGRCVEGEGMVECWKEKLIEKHRIEIRK